MRDEDISNGSHFWAKSDGKLVVLLKTQKMGYEVCGAWECGISFDEFEFIEYIKKPKFEESTELYYM